MLDRKEIDGEIAKWEALESSYPNYFKLATLYTVRDHMDAESRPFEGVGYSAAAAPPQAETVDVYGDSDFLQAKIWGLYWGFLTISWTRCEW